MSTGERRHELDGVRGIAILLVLVGHADYRLAPLAAAGVALFFALSGYLITGLLLAEHQRRGQLDLRRFYLRRLTRLAPPLFVMLAVMGPVLGVGWGILGPATWTANYAAVVDAVPAPLEHTWSLAVEEQFYLVWPAALLLLLRLRRPGRALAAVMVGLICWWGLLVAAGHLDYAYGALETAGVPILGGCLLALRPGRARRAVEPLTALLVFAGVLAVVDVPGAWMAVPILSVPLTAALVGAARGSRWLSWRPLGWCGTASYSLYLWHLPGAWLVGGGTVTAAGVLVGAGFGVVAWWLVERPVMVWRSRQASSRTPAPDVASTVATSTGTPEVHASGWRQSRERVPCRTPDRLPARSA